MTKWWQLPKIELHLHLDCSLSYEVVSQLAPYVTPDVYARDYVLPSKCENLADFLTRVPRSVELLQTEKALRLAVNDLFKQLRDDNVLYVEIRFAPLLHLQQGLSVEEVVWIVEDETGKASQKTGIEASLILCTLRHFTAEQSLQTAQLVHQFKGSYVVALDIAGDEEGYPITAHEEAFQYAIAHDVPRTAHAGEACGPQSIWETLEHFQPSRIGHGVRSIADSALLDYLKTRNIHLEICPTCNIQIDIFPTYTEHPIDKLYRQGVSVGVNTDGRTLPQVTLTEEYEKLAHVFGWQKEDFLACNIQALQASFAPPQVKAKLMQRLKEGDGSEIV